MSKVETLLESLRPGPMTSVELQRKHGLSQPSMSRLLRRAGDRIVHLGRGRSSRYFLTAPTFGVAPQIPIFEVTQGGVIRELGLLRGLAGGFVVEAPDMPWWLMGVDKGLFQSLPYYLYDLHPSGFLGRQLARRLSRGGAFPMDPRRWTDEHIGRFLLSEGLDLPGNLVVGDAAAQRVNRRDTEIVGDRAVAYPRLAERALNDEAPGSSAAGEQPKFAIHQQDVGHVIVKFTASGPSPEARRWRDLFHAEYHAQRTLGAQGVPAARCEIFTLAGRVFIESRRFDRIGARGRLAALSMSTVDAEFVGEGQGWARVAEALHGERLLDARSLSHIRWAEAFGEWIGNSDMHLGNLSLAPRPRGFELLPIYDMLPMVFAPIRGDLPKPRFSPPLQTTSNREVWESAGRAAVVFWDRVASDEGISHDFRHLAREYGRSCVEVLETDSLGLPS